MAMKAKGGPDAASGAPPMDTGIAAKDRAKLASIRETVGQPKAGAMARLRVEGNEAVVRTAPGSFPAVDAAGDEPAADLLTQRMQIHEKNAWMLRSLLEGRCPPCRDAAPR